MRAWRYLTAAVVLGGCLRMDVFVFRPRPAPEGAGDLMADSKVPEDLRQELVDEIVSDDGVKVSGWLLSHRDDDGTRVDRHELGVVYCHGNDTHIGTTEARLDAIWALGYTVLAFDARGYGKTPVPETGQTQQGVYADGRAAYEYLITREDLGMRKERVGLYGRSLGSAICLQVATDAGAPAVALESAIGPLQQMIDDSTAIDTPSDWWIDSTMDNATTVESFSGALLIMHGLADDYVQPAYGQEIFDRATSASSRELWLVPERGHSDLPCAKPTTTLPDGDCEGGFSDGWTAKTTALFDAALR